MNLHRQPITLLLLFISSLLLNACLLYKINYTAKHTKAELTWSLKAAAEAEAVAANKCSGHGRVFLDGLTVDGEPKCECNTCYVGSDCSLLNSTCSADADGGDPVFLEAYWQKHPSTGAVLVSGWHRMSYVTTGANFMSIELENHIRLLHEAVGNAVTDNRFIVFGTGSTQLINALVYALSPDYSGNASVAPAKVVASAPYYPVYKSQTNVFDAKEYEWEGITSQWDNSNNSGDSRFIEFVTSPNNPDGLLKHSVLRNSSVIHDRCYYWPHYTAISKAADDDIMMFSFSKMSGHASSRFGWVLLKNKKVYEKVSRYMQLNSMGVSRDTQLRMLTIIKVILSNIKKKNDIFHFGYGAMKAKWSRLNNLVSSSNRFSLPRIEPVYCSYFQRVKDPSPAYAWLKCEKEEDEDCEVVLRNGGIISRSGVFYEAGSKYTRLSLIKNQDDFELLMQKMESIISNQENGASI